MALIQTIVSSDKREFICAMMVLGNGTSSTTNVVPRPQGEGELSTVFLRKSLENIGFEPLRTLFDERSSLDFAIGERLG